MPPKEETVILSDLTLQLSQLSSSLSMTESDLHKLMNFESNLENPLDQASKDIHLAFTLNTLVLLALKATGTSAKGHAVKGEMDRVKEYFKKLESARSGPQKGLILSYLYSSLAPMKVDQAAAKRFVKRALPTEES